MEGWTAGRSWGWTRSTPRSRPAAAARHAGPARDLGRLPAALPADLRRPARAARGPAPAPRARWAPSCTSRCGRSTTCPPARRTPDAAAALVDRHWSGEGFRDAEQAARVPPAGAGVGRRLRRRRGSRRHAGRAGALGVGVDAADRRRGPRRPDRRAGDREAGRRRLQDGPAAGPPTTPAARRRWRSTPSAPGTRCAGPARASSCTTCPPARSSAAVARRGVAAGAPRARRGRRPGRGRRRRRAGRGRRPGRAVPRRGPRPAAARATSAGTAREGRAAAPEREPWASLEP